MKSNETLPVKQIPGGIIIQTEGTYQSEDSVAILDKIITSLSPASKVIKGNLSAQSLIVPLNNQYNRYINFENKFQVTYPSKVLGIVE